MVTLEETINTAKGLGIKFELRPLNDGFAKERYDVFQFYECWSDEEFEKFLLDKINKHERITFIKLLQKYEVLINHQLII